MPKTNLVRCCPIALRISHVERLDGVWTETDPTNECMGDPKSVVRGSRQEEGGKPIEITDNFEVEMIWEKLNSKIICKGHVKWRK